MMNPMSTRNLTTAFLALAIFASAVAQTEPQPTVTVAGAEASEGVATRDRDTLSVDFPDEEIRTVLRNVADLFELNVVIPDTLTGRTSIKLRDVSWRQIFQVVLAPAGYTYIEEGNIIKVVSNESLTMEPVATDVFIINHARAEDLRPTIAGLVDPAAGGKIEINARSNALIITERPSRMGRIRAIIEQLDKATAQVMIESQFVEVTDRDIRNIGVNWASLQGMTLGAGNLNQAWQRGSGQDRSHSNSFNSGESVNAGSGVSADSSSIANTTSGNSVSSTSSTQTNTGTQLLPVTTTDLLGNTSTTFQVVPIASQGVTTNSTTNVTTGTSISDTLSNAASSAVNNTATAAVNNLLGLAGGSSQSRLATAVFSASDFNIIVSALKAQNNTKVVSNPTIVTLNNSEATLNIGSEFPIPNYTYNAERGIFEVSGFQYKPIGVILRVTPQVNAQGTIRLALEPEVSQQNGETSFGGAGGAQIPIIATRKVKTQVSLKDGYTAGIGGLISTSKTHGGTKVPVLGSIPVLGRLFSSKSVNDQTTNLLIFITAKTVNPDGAAPGDVFNATALESVGVDASGAPLLKK